MRHWDLSAGGAKLQLSLEVFRRTAHDVGEQWQDEANRQLQETYFDPLEQSAARALEAIFRLAQVLAKAEQECGSY